MQHNLTSAQRGYIARRVQSCDVDDITQSVMIRLWQIDTRNGLPSDPAEREALTWTIVRGKVVDHHRIRGRHACDSLGEYDPAERIVDDAPDVDVESLLQHAGSCADSIRRHYLDGEDYRSAVDRADASRGIRRIRAALGIISE